MRTKNNIPILEKAIDVIEYISAHTEPVSQPELQRMLNISQASCYRIIATMLERNWLVKRNNNLYDVSGVFSVIAEKYKFRLDKYKKLQPVLNYLANATGYSVKVSVRDGDEFVNACSAKVVSDVTIISEPGFRFPLSEVASVSTIFLSEENEKEQQRILRPEDWEKFQKGRKNYHKDHFSYNPGSAEPGAAYHYDTLSFPIRYREHLVAVISFLSLPGQLKNAKRKITSELEKSLPQLADLLHDIQNFPA